jgi:hypothetical protein
MWSWREAALRQNEIPDLSLGFELRVREFKSLDISDMAQMMRAPCSRTGRN